MKTINQQMKEEMERINREIKKMNNTFKQMLTPKSNEKRRTFRTTKRN